MGTEVDVFGSIQEEASKTAKKISDRIREELVSQISDEMWAQVVAAEVKNFFEDNRERNRWGDVIKGEAPFKTMIKEELRKIMSDRIKTALTDQAWQTKWLPSGHEAASEMAIKIAQEHGARILQDITASIAQNVIAQMRNSQGY